MNYERAQARFTQTTVLGSLRKENQKELSTSGKTLTGLEQRVQSCATQGEVLISNMEITQRGLTDASGRLSKQTRQLTQVVVEKTSAEKNRETVSFQRL